MSSRVLLLPRLALGCVFGSSAALMLYLSGAVSAAAAEPSPIALKTWAVLSQQQVRASGLSDLVTAKLSEQKVEMVERDALDLVFKEAEVTGLLGSAAGSQRARLGQLVKADALLLLSFEVRGGARVLQTVISDCQMGLRLEVVSLPFGKGGIERIADEIVRLALETRKRFAGGVKQAIGVPRFVSKNFLHRFDYLQVGYAQVLQHALVSAPGVAVIETDEAAAIVKELALAGEDQLKDRLVPTFVEGEFEVLPADVPEKSQVRFGFTFSRPGAADEKFAVTVPQGQLADVLTRQVPEKILRSAPVGFSRQRQAQLLADRAEVFRLLGDREYATRLLQGALLLEPENTPYRFRLLQVSVNQFVELNNRGSIYRAVKEKEWLANVAQRQQLVTSLVEGVIRDRAVNPREAGVLLTSIERLSARLDYYNNRYYDVARREDLRTWFRRVLPLIAGLDYGVARGAVRPLVTEGLWTFDQHYLRTASYRSRQSSRAEQDEEWCTRAAVAVLGNSVYFEPPLLAWAKEGRVYGPLGPEDRFAEIEWFLEEVVPPKVMVSALATELVERGGFRQAVQMGYVREDDVRAFYKKLLKSKKPYVAFYGRCGELFWRHRELPKSEALHEADALLAIARTAPAHPPQKSFPELLTSLRSAIASGSAAATTVARVPGPEGGARRLSKPRTEPAEAGRRVRFERIEGLHAKWNNLLQCEGGLDVLWSQSRAYRMARPGVVEPIAVHWMSHGELQQVVWDGKQIWILTARPKLLVYSRDGKLIGEVPEKEIPTDDLTWPAQLGPQRGPPQRMRLNSPMLHPVEPGKCLLVAQINPSGRTFMAMASEGSPRDGSAYHLQVFHTARKIFDDSNVDDLDRLFAATGVIEPVGGSQRGSRVVLVTRSAMGRSCKPLAVDLSTLKVSVHGATLPPASFRCAVGSRIFSNFNGQVTVVSPAQDARQPWTARKLNEPNPLESPLLTPDSYRSPLVHGRFVYVPGRFWHRVDPRTLEYELLTKQPLPAERCYESYAISAHYGLIAWSGDLSEGRTPFGMKPSVPARGPVYRVHIDSPAGKSR